MLLQGRPIFDCHPGELFLEEMCVGPRQDEAEGRELGGRLKHTDKLYIQNEVKFVFNNCV